MDVRHFFREELCTFVKPLSESVLVELDWENAATKESRVREEGVQDGLFVVLRHTPYDRNVDDVLSPDGLKDVHHDPVLVIGISCQH